VEIQNAPSGKVGKDFPTEGKKVSQIKKAGEGVSRGSGELPADRIERKTY